MNFVGGMGGRMTGTAFRLKVDVSGSQGLVSSRGEGALVTNDVVMPGHCQVVTVLTVPPLAEDGSYAWSHQASFTCDAPMAMATPEKHVPAVPRPGIHAPFRCNAAALLREIG